MPDPVIHGSEATNATNDKRKRLRNNVRQFRAMFIGLTFAVLSAFGCIFFLTPPLVKQLILADAESLSLEWLQEVETQSKLPGDAPESYLNYLGLMHDFFLHNDNSNSKPGYDLDHPQNFNLGERFATIKGYTIFTGLDRPVMVGGIVDRDTYEDKAHTANFFTAWKNRSTVTLELQQNSSSDSAQNLIRVYVPLIKGMDVTGIAVVDVDKTTLEIAIRHALERGALLLTGLVSVGAFLFLLLLRSIAQRRDDAENEAHFLAYRDPLTRLPNRRCFQEKLPLWIAEIASQNGGALLCVDVDRFKEVNDFHGHPVGDKLLMEIARRLKGAVGENQVYRLSGDEFTVLVTNQPDEDTVSRVVASIISACNGTMKFNGALIENNLSIGAALCPDHSDDPSQLLRFADLALYEAKEQGRGKCVSFNPELSRRLRRRAFVLDKLTQAIAQEELVTLFQPQVNLKKGEIVGCEALVRMPQIKGDFISPAEFIPLAETNGLIGALGEQVLRAACRAAMDWPDGTRVAVNVSPVQLRMGGLPLLVRQVLEETGLDPKRLELEITEGVFLQDEKNVLDQLHDLREMGVGLALDDFGTGFSSLNYLTTLPLTKIKIDRSFVIKMLNDPIATTIIESVVQIASAMNADVIAEGIEEHEQAAFISQLGCHFVQGFLFGKPVEQPFKIDSPVKLQVEELGRRLAG